MRHISIVRSYLQKDQMLIKLLVVDINESLALSLEITDNYGKTNENSHSPLVLPYISQCRLNTRKFPVIPPVVASYTSHYLLTNAAATILLLGNK